MPTMLRRVFEMEVRSLGAGGAFSPVLGVMKVDVPVILVSASLAGEPRLGEPIVPEMVGFSEAVALPVNWGR